MWDWWVYEKALHLPLNFAVNLTSLKQIYLKKEASERGGSQALGQDRSGMSLPSHFVVA